MQINRKHCSHRRIKAIEIEVFFCFFGWSTWPIVQLKSEKKTGNSSGWIQVFMRENKWMLPQSLAKKHFSCWNVKLFVPFRCFCLLGVCIFGVCKKILAEKTCGKWIGLGIFARNVFNVHPNYLKRTFFNNILMQDVTDWWTSSTQSIK